MKLIKQTIVLITSILMAFAFQSCREKKPEILEDDESEIKKAVAVLQPLNNSNVSGIVYFNMTTIGVEVIADIDGLDEGEHGFHIHQFGDLRTPDGSSLGGHFNPGNKPHGKPNDEMSHAGDMPNIVAFNDSTAHLEFTNAKVSFSGEENIIGRAIVIHALEDDFESQPSGAAGNRVAAGVIGILNPDVK